MSDEPVPGSGAAPRDDPTEASRWRPVFRLLSDMDDEIARVYADNGISDLKPSWVLEVVRLHARGPMTIAELARSVGRTHSALSQKVAAMSAAGWLDTAAGPDARTKKVTLTPKAERIAPLLAAEWRATEAAIAEIESELPYPLTQVAEDIRSLLAGKGFHDRITEWLAADGSWPGRLPVAGSPDSCPARPISCCRSTPRWPRPPPVNVLAGQSFSSRVFTPPRRGPMITPVVPTTQARPRHLGVRARAATFSLVFLRVPAR